MKKLLWFVLAVTLAMPAAAAEPTNPDRWYPGKKAQALAAFYTMLCEDVLGGLYGYTQTETGPTAWSCVTPSNPMYRPIRDSLERRKGKA